MKHVTFAGAVLRRNELKLVRGGGNAIPEIRCMPVGCIGPFNTQKCKSMGCKCMMNDMAWCVPHL